MSAQFKRWIFSKLVAEGSRSSVIEAAAKKAVRLEREGGQKLGIWAGAVAGEIYADVQSLMGGGAAAPADTDAVTEKKPGQTGARRRNDDDSGPSQR